MIFLSAFLLSIASNLETLRISLSYGIKKIYLGKSITILLAIITSVGTFISMYIGKLILYLFPHHLSNIFGAVLLSFTGIYFIVEYIRLENKRANYDTSHYWDGTLKYKNILENPSDIDSYKSNHIGIRECLRLSTTFISNNLFTCFAASITGINISYSVFLNFIIVIFCVYLGAFNSNIYLSKFISKYSNLMSGITLIILGIFQTFV